MVEWVWCRGAWPLDCQGLALGGIRVADDACAVWWGRGVILLTTVN